MPPQRAERCRFCNNLLNFLNLDSDLKNLEFCSWSCKSQYEIRSEILDEYAKQKRIDVEEKIQEIIKRNSSRYF